MSKTDQALRRLVAYVNMPEFPPGRVPIAAAAELMGKSVTFVRAGLEQGWLPIGYVMPSQGEEKKNSYYISPKLLWEVTGIVYDPGKEKGNRNAR